MTENVILIADDTPTNVYVLAAMLRALGFDCRIAADGAEAVEMAAADPPKLILMDINMPRLNGIEAAQRIRAVEAHRVAIVAVTAHPDSRHLPDFKAAAFDDFMVKPVDMTMLREIVARYLDAP